MEDFKRIVKMKTGGSVNKAIASYEKRDRKTVEEADTAQDKAIVKKAIGMHDKQEHPGEKTDLSKLRKGGRAKKDCGTVKKYACGGGVYGAKKTKEDIKSIDDAKNCKPKKLAKGGKSVKKMADGGMTNPMTDASALLNPIRSAGTALRNNVMGTPEQNRIAQARMDMIAAKKKAAEQAALLGGLGGGAALQQGAMAGAQMQGVQPQNVMQQMANSPEAMPKPAGPASVANFGTPSVESLKSMGQGMGINPVGQKRGGKVKKC